MTTISKSISIHTNALGDEDGGRKRDVIQSICMYTHVTIRSASRHDRVAIIVIGSAGVNVTGGRYE